MTDKARITELKTLSCGAAWRNYYFVKVTTADGTVGWSEFDEGFGSPGVGTPHHMAMELFKVQTSLFMLHVPYRGSAGYTQDLLSGEVNVGFLPVHIAQGFVRDGKLTALAVGSASAADERDAGLEAYVRAPGEVAGSLKCVGSDTMNNLVALWSEGFKKHYPSVREAIEGKGSASGPPAPSGQ